MADNRCSHCGRFLVMDETVSISTVPDTHFGPEKTTITCMACRNKKTCPKCGREEIRVDGYCSVYCRDMAEKDEEINRLQAELQKAAAANNGNWHFELWEQLRAIQDGNCYMIARPDFVDLQNSPVVFYERGSWQYDIIHEWQNATPLAHLPLTELAYILDKLYGGEK